LTVLSAYACARPNPNSIVDVLHKKILKECVFDTLALLLKDPDASVVRNAMIALRGLLRYRSCVFAAGVRWSDMPPAMLAERVVESDTASALWANMKLRLSYEVLELLALIVKYGKLEVRHSQSTHFRIDDERKMLFVPNVISSIKDIITNSNSYDRQHAIGILKQALDYGTNPVRLHAMIGSHHL